MAKCAAPEAADGASPNGTIVPLTAHYGFATGTGPSEGRRFPRNNSPMSRILRLGISPRFADVVIHGGTASWVEVAKDTTLDTDGQISQVLAQIDTTLPAIGSDRTKILQVIIHLADLSDGGTLDRLWDAWVPKGHPPVRARVQSGLGGNCRVEMVVTAAVDAESGS